MPRQKDGRRHSSPFLPLAFLNHPQSESSVAPADVRPAGDQQRSKKKTHERISGKVVLVGFHAPRLLLFMEAGLGLAPRGFGCPHCARLLFHSRDLNLLHTQEARPALPLDVCQLWDVHPGLWYHAHYGSLDTLAWDLLALWGDQSCHGYGLGPHGDTACSIRSPDAGTSEPGSHEARNCRAQTRRAGASSSEQ